jgi:hypothetical protein
VRTRQKQCWSRILPTSARRKVASCPRRSVAETVQLAFDSVAQYRPFAWRGAENDAKHWNVRSTRSLLLQPEAWQTTGYGSTAVRLHRHPYIGALQTGVYLERQFSRIFPAHPRSLARRFSRATSPRHAQTARRGPRFCGLRASAFPGLLPQPDALGPHSGKCSSCLGSGAHSRRFAQECPEGNPGKYNQGEKQWHSTKTRSL